MRTLVYVQCEGQHQWIMLRRVQWVLIWHHWLLPRHLRRPLPARQPRQLRQPDRPDRLRHGGSVVTVMDAPTATTELRQYPTVHVILSYRQSSDRAPTEAPTAPTAPTARTARAHSSGWQGPVIFFLRFVLFHTIPGRESLFSVFLGYMRLLTTAYGHCKPTYHSDKLKHTTCVHPPRAGWCTSVIAHPSSLTRLTT